MVRFTEAANEMPPISRVRPKRLGGQLPGNLVTFSLSSLDVLGTQASKQASKQASRQVRSSTRLPNTATFLAAFVGAFAASGLSTCQTRCWLQLIQLLSTRAYFSCMPTHRL